MNNEITNVMDDNSVGRLYNIIKKLKEVGGANAEDSFCKVFSLERGDKVSIFNCYAELYKLCSLGINEIEQLNPKNVHKFKRTLNNVIEGLSKVYFNAMENVLNNGMDKFNDYFSDKLMIELEYCADYLSENSDEGIIEDDKIQQLIKEINDMIKDIMDSRLDDELEKLLVYQLNNIRESLLKYKFYGSKGIETSIETTLGSLILNKEKATDSKSIDAVNKIFKIMGKINTIIGFSRNSKDLLESICKFFISNK